MSDVKILSELQECLTPLFPKEKEELEESILENGCRDALVLWGDILVDGHNRYEICTKHNIPFETTNMEFENMEEAKRWIYKNQLARRNLTDAERIEIAKKITKSKSEEAKIVRLGNLKQNTENANVTHSEDNNSEKINVNKEIAEIADVSERTVARYNTIQNKAPENVINAVKNNTISISRGYDITKKVENLPKEQKEEKSDELINDFMSKEYDEECRRLDIEHKIFCKINDAVYKPISVEITEENVSYWIEDKTREELEREERNIDKAIANLKEIKEILKNYKGIRRVK